jgi:hypothetical protein
LLLCPIVSFSGLLLFRLGHPPHLIPQSHWSSCSRFSHTAYPHHVLLSLSVLAASVPQFSCCPPRPGCAPFAIQSWNPHCFIVVSRHGYVSVILQTAPANPISHAHCIRGQRSKARRCRGASRGDEVLTVKLQVVCLHVLITHRDVGTVM